MLSPLSSASFSLAKNSFSSSSPLTWITCPAYQVSACWLLSQGTVLIFFRKDWLVLLAVQGSLSNSLQIHNLKVSIFFLLLLVPSFNRRILSLEKTLLFWILMALKCPYPSWTCLNLWLCSPYNNFFFTSPTQSIFIYSWT